MKASLHPLRIWRKQHALTLDAVAATARTTGSSLSRIERGRQKPSLDLMERLIGASGGALRAEDFLSAPVHEIAARECPPSSPNEAEKTVSRKAVRPPREKAAA